MAKWEGDCFWYSRLKVRFLPPQERKMIADRRSRVGKVMTGYAGKKESVTVPKGIRKVVSRLVGEGYRKGYSMETDSGARVDEVNSRRSQTNQGKRTKGLVKQPEVATCLPNQRLRSKANTSVLRVYLAYTVTGNVVRPALSSMVRLSKESRPMYVSAEERWIRSGEAGRLRRETTEGRRTGPEARKKGVGGRRRRSRQ